MYVHTPWRDSNLSRMQRTTAPRRQGSNVFSTKSYHPMYIYVITRYSISRTMSYNFRSYKIGKNFAKIFPEILIVA
jgi:hypothetical protein